MSPASRNAFFGTGYFGYYVGPQSFSARSAFYPWDKSAFEFWSYMGLAVVFAILSTRVGLAWGDWMKRVRR
jgi:hypothetical protein